jgi:hypothetical protein
MNKLKNNLWPGKVTVDTETFKIYEGRLSFTPKEDFYLLNFWMVSEDSDSKNNVFPPTIEILMKTKVDLLKTNTLKLEIPGMKEAGDEWQVNYATGYYDGIHQNFIDAKIEISKIEEDLYSVEFSGKPEMYKSVKGNCRLELKNELSMIWD